MAQINSRTSKIYLLLVLMLIQFTAGEAQTRRVNQFWNEFAFTKPLAKGWALESNIGQSYTSNGTSKSPFANGAQWYLRQWINYYPSARWKTAFFAAYYHNSQVEGIEQIANNEWRWALEASYYIHKIGYTLNTRTRFENRGITDENGERQTSFRFRQQLRCRYPLGGSKVVRSGVWYLLASDELMFKSIGQFFDRNRLTLGGGYSITDDVQVEVTYANEYLPRSTTNELYNALQVNFVFNNLFSNLKSRWQTKTPASNVIIPESNNQ